MLLFHYLAKRPFSFIGYVRLATPYHMTHWRTWRWTPLKPLLRKLIKAWKWWAVCLDFGILLTFFQSRIRFSRGNLGKRKGQNSFRHWGSTIPRVFEWFLLQPNLGQLKCWASQPRQRGQGYEHHGYEGDHLLGWEGHSMVTYRCHHGWKPWSSIKRFGDSPIVAMFDDTRG